MKKAFITGANKGIGFETARQLLQQGYYVYIGSRNLQNGLRAVDKLKAEQLVNVEAIEIDVTDEHSVNSARAAIGSQTEVLDVLINNAGISGGAPYTALEAGREQFLSVFNTNVFGAASVTQAFIDLLKRSAAPRIVMVSTSVGSLTLQSDPDWPAYHFGKFAVYGASKAALNMFTVHLAYELRDSPFKVNAVCPGYTRTDFTAHNGGEVREAGKRIVKYALLDEQGVTGKFISEETEPENGKIAW